MLCKQRYFWKWKGLLLIIVPWQQVQSEWDGPMTTGTYACPQLYSPTLILVPQISVITVLFQMKRFLFQESSFWTRDKLHGNRDMLISHQPLTAWQKITSWLVSEISLDQKLAIFFFCKEPAGKYCRLHGPWGLCSTLLS